MPLATTERDALTIARRLSGGDPSREVGEAGPHVSALDAFLAALGEVDEEEAIALLEAAAEGEGFDPADVEAVEEALREVWAGIRAVRAAFLSVDAVRYVISLDPAT